MDRYHPVVIGRYIGDCTGRFTCWAIADREQANRVISSDKYDTYEQAKRQADRMNGAREEQANG